MHESSPTHQYASLYFVSDRDVATGHAAEHYIYFVYEVHIMSYDQGWTSGSLARSRLFWNVCSIRIFLAWVQHTFIMEFAPNRACEIRAGFSTVTSEAAEQPKYSILVTQKTSSYRRSRQRQRRSRTPQNN